MKWTIGAILVLALAAYVAFGRSMTLQPLEPLRLVRSLELLNSTDPDAIVATITTGESAQVTECHNLVDDQVYRVRTMAGTEGFVAGGRFKIERHSVWRSIGGDKVFCW